MLVNEIKAASKKISDNVAKAIVGKEAEIEKILISLLCGGHILLEDMPGTGKTTLAKALAKSIDLSFGRVQFTPDLLPTDVTGLSFFNQKTEEFVIKKGPVFSNILLADEINRATPRTQSSLLECMEERQVTIDGQTFALEQPFIVIATQNPIEIQGTFPLPEAQIDRFFMRLALGYPDHASELKIMGDHLIEAPVASLASVMTKSELIEAQQAVKTVAVGEAVKGYILSIVEATRSHPAIRLGASTRGTLALQKAAQAAAALGGRDYVLPDDVKSVASEVLSHRLIFKGLGLAQAGSRSDIVKEILDATEVPKE